MIVDSVRDFLRRPDVADAPLRYLCRRLIAPSLALSSRTRLRRFRVADGLWMEADVGDVVGRNLFVHGVFEWEVHRTLSSLLGRDMVFLDVGAHVGSFTVPMAALVGPAGRVIAVEPDPANRRRLRRNLDLNKLAERVTLLDVAALDRHASMPLGRTAEGNSGSNRLGEGDQFVRCLPLDELADVAELDRLDVVKLDVEGFEREALQGLRHTLSRHRPLVLLEVNGPEALELLVDSFGYHVSLLGLDGVLTPWTGARTELKRARDTVNALATPIRV